MQVIDRDSFGMEHLNLIRKGAVFIYGTDTIYGIGCDATNEKAVERIRSIKDRDNKPFSVIAPSKEWIKENCELFGHDSLLNKIPGPYTLILNLTKAANLKVNPGLDTLGVRIPEHWFSAQVKKLGIPIVTTSVNKTGAHHMTCLEDADKDILSQVDFIIYEGKKEGRPSTLIIIDEKSIEVKER